jgi:hypothetical protein
VCRMMRVSLMRGFLIIIALLSASASNARAQADSPKLVITASILSQQYSCASGTGMTTLQLRLRLRYTNAGNPKLIVYRGEDLFYQAKIRSVVQSEEARPYEIDVLNARYLEVENEPVEQSAPGKLFVTLQPGASFEMETMVGVGVVGRSDPRDRHAIREGEHTLQLVVATWYRSPALAMKLRQQWQRKGYLWSSTIASSPITFRAERPQPALPCK